MSTTTEKRSLESASDAPVEVPAGKRRCEPCKNCACTQKTTICTVTTRSGDVEVPLCRRCVSKSERGERLLLLLGYADGADIPRLVPASRADADAILCDFADRSSLPRCGLCECNLDVVKCHPLMWKTEISCIRNKSIAHLRCIHCRICDECGECAGKGEGIHDRGANNGPQLCSNCAMWCLDCDEIVGVEHWQNASDAESRPLCRHMCCGCQEEEADVHHPDSGRGYCRDCVANRNVWTNFGTEGPDDEDEWDEMNELLGNEQEEPPL